MQTAIYTNTHAKTYTLLECIKIALENNKDYLIAKKEVDIKKATVSSARADYLLPTFALNGQYMMLDPKTIDDAKIPQTNGSVIDTQLTHNWTLGLGVQYHIFTWFKQRDAYNLAQKDMKMAEKKLLNIKSLTKSSVSKAFYSLLLSRKLLEVAKANDNRLKAYVAVAQRNFNAGRQSRYELLRTQVQLANNKPKLLSAENGVKLAMVSLLQLLSMDLNKKIQISGKLITSPIKISEKEAIKRALSNRYEIILNKLGHEILKIRRSLARSANKPNITAFFNANLDYKKPGNYFSPTFATADRTIVGSWYTGIQISIPISELFPWSKTSKDIDVAQHSLDQSILIQEKTIEMIRLEIKQAVLKLDESDKSILANKTTIKLAQEGLRTAKIRYYNGQMGNVELMDAELDYQQAQANLYQSWFNYISAKIDLKKAMGIY